MAIYRMLTRKRIQMQKSVSTMPVTVHTDARSVLSAVLGVVTVCLISSTSAGQNAAAEESNEIMHMRQMNSLDAVEKRDIRDPFWPVGYYPEWWRKPVVPSGGENVQVPKPDKWTEARKQIKVSGMSRMGNSGFFAVINGKTVTEGEVVSVSLDGMTYRWTVSEISEKGLKLVPIDN